MASDSNNSSAIEDMHSELDDYKKLVQEFKHDQDSTYQYIKDLAESREFSHKPSLKKQFERLLDDLKKHIQKLDVSVATNLNESNCSH